MWNTSRTTSVGYCCALVALGLNRDTALPFIDQILSNLYKNCCSSNHILHPLARGEAVGTTFCADSAYDFVSGTQIEALKSIQSNLLIKFTLFYLVIRAPTWAH
ncbi:hypothetical protein ACJX0J_005571, partial [Zea mays]